MSIIGSVKFPRFIRDPGEATACLPIWLGESRVLTIRSGGILAILSRARVHKRKWIALSIGNNCVFLLEYWHVKITREDQLTTWIYQRPRIRRPSAVKI